MMTRIATILVVAAFFCAPAVAAPLTDPAMKRASDVGTMLEPVRGHGGGHGHASFGGGRMAFSHGSGARFFSGHHHRGRGFEGYSGYYGYYGDGCWWSRRYHRWV